MYKQRRMLITGSRNWTDKDIIHKDISAARAFSKLIVVHGDCPTGADNIAKLYCIEHGIEQELHPADWKKFGKRAGFVRNREMVYSGVNMVFAYIKDNSAGASMTLDMARSLGVPCVIRRA